MNAWANILEMETSTVALVNGDRRHSCLCQSSEMCRESDLASKTSKLYGWLEKDTATLIDVLKEARSASESLLRQLPSSLSGIRICKR